MESAAVGRAVVEVWVGHLPGSPPTPHCVTHGCPPQQPPAPCVPGPHTNPPTPQTPPPILLLTRWSASGLPHLGPWGRPASGMGPDVSRWGRVALTHKPVADRLLLHCTATTAHLLLTQLAYQIPPFPLTPIELHPSESSLFLLLLARDKGLQRPYMWTFQH